MADGSIILDTRINNKGAYAELKELQAKAKSTAQQVAALDRQINTANSIWRLGRSFPMPSARRNPRQQSWKA